MKKITIKGPNEVIYEHITKNGLRVFIWPNEKNNEVSLTLTVKYGSIHTKFKVDNNIYEVPKGTAHFLEHIKFNESNETTAHDYYSSHGSYVNAYTTYDHTSYEVTCNNNIEDNLKHLLFFVYNGFFTKSLIEKEKPIIVEESKMVLDNPYNKGYQALSNNLYFNNNRKYLITGEEKDINSIDIKDVENVFNNFYHPKNMFLTICGNVDINNIINVVDDFMLSQTFKEYTDPIWINEKEPFKVKKINDSINANVSMAKLMISIKIPLSNFKDYDKIHTLNLLNLLFDINFGSTSLFNEYLVNKDLKDEFYYYLSYEEEYLIINFEISSKYPNKVLDLVLNKYRNLEVNKDDFKRKIKASLASLILGFEDVNEVNSLIRGNYVKYGKIIDDYPEIVNSLTINDLNNINNCLKEYVYTSMILLPKDTL